MKEVTNCLKRWLPYIGYLFVSVISIIGAFRIDNLYLRILLIVSALVSLVLGVSRLNSSNSIVKRVKELEDNQHSFEVEGEVLSISNKKNSK